MTQPLFLSTVGSGSEGGAGAAFRAPGSLATITGDPAIGTVGRDGNLWRKID